MSVFARRLTDHDIDACMALVAEAGWNQTANDWTTIFAVGEGRGLFVDGKLIATAAVVPHGSVGWVCMVLVTAREQRRGFATQLLEWAGVRLGELGLTPGLDATSAGRQVYLRMGYRDIYPITRLQCEKSVGMKSAQTAPNIRAVSPDDVDALLALDRSAFVLDRAALLASLVIRQPRLAFAKFAGNRCIGFVLGREGRQATQLGPLVAQDEQTASQLLSAALAELDGPVYIDVPDRHEALRTTLDRKGFVVQRQFTRMLHDCSEPFDDVSKIFALTGPEFA